MKSSNSFPVIAACRAKEAESGRVQVWGNHRRQSQQGRVDLRLRRNRDSRGANNLDCRCALRQRQEIRCARGRKADCLSGIAIGGSRLGRLCLTSGGVFLKTGHPSRSESEGRARCSSSVASSSLLDLRSNGQPYCGKKGRTMNPLIQLKTATLLFLVVVLAATFVFSTPSPSPCHERLFKFCETCRNPAYGPEWGNPRLQLDRSGAKTEPYREMQD
jgi:hypothetical protein